MRRPPSPDPFVVSADEMPQSERTKGPPQPTLIASEPVSGTERRTDIDRFTITKAALISVAANNSSVVEGAGSPHEIGSLCTSALCPVPNRSRGQIEWYLVRADSVRFSVDLGACSKSGTPQRRALYFPRFLHFARARKSLTSSRNTASVWLKRPARKLRQRRDSVDITNEKS